MFDRIRHAHSLVAQHPWASLLAILGEGYAAFGLWRDDFATPMQQQTLRAVNFLPHFATHTWITIGALIAVAWLFEASFKQQRPGMRIMLNKDAVWLPSWDIGPAGKVETKALVKLVNSTDKKLEDCRIQIRVTAAEKDGRPKGQKYVVSQPFSLVPDDERLVPLFGYDFDGADASLSVPMMSDSGVLMSGVLRPANYKVVVEALSAQSRIARLHVKLDFNNGHWIFNGHPSSTR